MFAKWEFSFNNFEHKFAGFVFKSSPTRPKWMRKDHYYSLILIYYPTKIWVAVRLPLEVFHDLTFGLFYHLYTELKYMHTITTTCLPHIDCTRKIHFILELCTSLFIIHFILFKNHTYIFWCYEYKTKMTTQHLHFFRTLYISLHNSFHIF